MVLELEEEKIKISNQHEMLLEVFTEWSCKTDGRTDRYLIQFQCLPLITALKTHKFLFTFPELFFFSIATTSI